MSFHPIFSEDEKTESIFRGIVLILIFFILGAIEHLLEEGLFLITLFWILFFVLSIFIIVFVARSIIQSRRNSKIRKQERDKEKRLDREMRDLFGEG